MIILILLILSITSCKQEDIKKQIEAAQNENRIPIIGKGVALDPSKATNCDEITDVDFDGICTIYYDSFERENLLHSSFAWEKVIIDTGFDGNNVNAEIVDTSIINSAYQGDKAVLFTGRDGASTHEIYLLTKDINLNKYEQVYIQFWYIGLSLEEEIILSWSQEAIQETLRVDICNDDDFNCGIEDTLDASKLRDDSVWDRFFIEDFNRGSNLNLNNYVEANWKVAQFLIDLKDYAARADKMSFKISVTIDEGFVNNNKANTLEDAILLDDVLIMGVNKSMILE